MLIKFESKAAAPFVMVDSDARALLRGMGQAEKIEGAVSGEYLRDALKLLEVALKAQALKEDALVIDEDEPDAELPLRTDVRAAPLLDMLHKAILEEASVMWQPE